MATDIDFFIYDFSAIDETDYGDFMRKANYLLIQLDEEMCKTATPEVRSLLDEMKNDIQFHPNWERESTREGILRLAAKVKELLAQVPLNLRRKVRNTANPALPERTIL